MGRKGDPALPDLLQVGNRGGGESIRSQPEQGEGDLDVLRHRRPPEASRSRPGDGGNDRLHLVGASVALERGEARQLQSPSGIRTGTTEGPTPLHLLGAADLARPRRLPSRRCPRLRLPARQIAELHLDVRLLTHRSGYTKSSQWRYCSSRPVTACW